MEIFLFFLVVIALIVAFCLVPQRKSTMLRDALTFQHCSDVTVTQRILSDVQEYKAQLLAQIISIPGYNEVCQPIHADIVASHLPNTTSTFWDDVSHIFSGSLDTMEYLGSIVSVPSQEWRDAWMEQVYGVNYLKPNILSYIDSDGIYRVE